MPKPSIRSSLLAVLCLCACGDSSPQEKLPVAHAGGPRDAQVGETLTFDGSDSTNAVSFHWDFGDNATADEATADHAYSAAGTYLAVLTVRNAAGGTARDTAEVTVAEDLHPAPTARITGPTTGKAGDALSFDGSTSSGALAITTYAWGFGDGTTATGVKATHLWAKDGQYAVRLTVTDTSGLVGVSSLTVTIGDAAGNRPPIAAPGAGVSARVGEKVALDGSQSFDPDAGDTLVGWDWDFGDGSAHATTTSPEHAWTTAGTFTLTLKVTDSRGATGSATTTATIRPPPDYTGRWSLQGTATQTCKQYAIAFPSPALDLTLAGTQLTGLDPADARHHLVGPLTTRHFALKGSYSESAGCGQRTVSEEFTGDFSATDDQALTGSWTIFHSYSDLKCNCSATFEVTGTRP